MSKAILIMDMPENCGECKLSGMSCDFDSFLCIPMQKFQDKFSKEKPDWCPLKELPDEQENKNYFDEFEDGYICGWNSCIREILRNFGIYKEKITEDEIQNLNNTEEMYSHLKDIVFDVDSLINQLGTNKKKMKTKMDNSTKVNIEMMTENPNMYVNLKDLVERFVEIDEYYNHELWNLQQIIANINVVGSMEINKRE